VCKLAAAGQMIHKCDEIICSIHQGGHPASHHGPPVVRLISFLGLVCAALLFFSTCWSSNFGPSGPVSKLQGGLWINLNLT